MQVSCPHCSRVLDFSGDPPVYCAYCGQPLKADPRLMATVAYRSPAGGSPGDATVASAGAGAAETVAVDPGSGSPRAAETMAGPCAGVAEPDPDPEQVAGYTIVRLLGRGAWARCTRPRTPRWAAAWR